MNTREQIKQLDTFRELSKELGLSANAVSVGLFLFTYAKQGDVINLDYVEFMEGMGKIAPQMTIHDCIEAMGDLAYYGLLKTT